VQSHSVWLSRQSTTLVSTISWSQVYLHSSLCQLCSLALSCLLLPSVCSTSQPITSTRWLLMAFRVNKANPRLASSTQMTLLDSTSNRTLQTVGAMTQTQTSFTPWRPKHHKKTCEACPMTVDSSTIHAPIQTSSTVKELRMSSLEEVRCSSISHCCLSRKLKLWRRGH